MQNTTKARDADIDQIAASIRPNDRDDLRKLFGDQGSRPPQIVWSPLQVDLTNPQIARFDAICQAMPQTDGRILAIDFDLDAVASLTDWLLLLDVEGDGTVYRYRHYGEGIADVRGVSMLGRTTGEFSGHIGQFFTAIYRAVQNHKQRLLTIHVPPGMTLARSWERLIVPLFDPAGEVVQFAVLSVPDNALRAGLELIPDPVLIADADQIVRYANRAARELFSRQTYLSANMDLFTFAGIDLDLPCPPADLARSGVVHDVISIVLRGTMIEHFLLTVSGTEQLGAACYVITLRPAIDQGNCNEPDKA